MEGLNQRETGHVAQLMLALVLIAAAGRGVMRAVRAAEPIQPVKPWDTFFSVVSVPSDKCYVFGAAGTFLAPADDGRTWARNSATNLAARLVKNLIPPMKNAKELKDKWHR